jgi:hypothetical protein
MADQDPQFVGFRFDEALGFTDNCGALLVSLDELDADMAKILRDNWDALVGVVQEGERDSKARGEFNAKVAAALDALAKGPANTKGTE